MRPADREAAAAALIGRHQKALWRFVRWLGARGDEADDAVQDAFLALLEEGPSGADDAAIAAWLRTVAARRFRLARRRARAGVPLDDPDLLERTWLVLAADGGDARLDALARCIGSLPERARGALELRHRHGMPLAQVGRTLGLGTSGTKRLLHRCRALLARCIERRTEERR